MATENSNTMSSSTHLVIALLLVQVDQAAGGVTLSPLDVPLTIAGIKACGGVSQMAADGYTYWSYYKPDSSDSCYNDYATDGPYHIYTTKLGASGPVWTVSLRGATWEDVESNFAGETSSSVKTLNPYSLITFDVSKKYVHQHFSLSGDAIFTDAAGTESVKSTQVPRASMPVGCDVDPHGDSLWCAWLPLRARSIV